MRSKAEGVVARAAGLVRAEVHTALLDSRGATPTHSPNHHSLLMMWSNKTLKNCISSIQMHHFSVTHEVFSSEKLGQEADLNLSHHAQLPRRSPACHQVVQFMAEGRSCVLGQKEL